MSTHDDHLTFLGAAGTVTGSKHWLDIDGRNYLIDAGIFQGDDELEQRDWKPLLVPPNDIDAVLLTHAHIDHTGYLPRLVADGYDGPVYATRATKSLLEVLLPDSAHIQEEQAKYANKKGYARHKPAKPLYTPRDAERALQLIQTIDFDRPAELFDGSRTTFRRAGHLLGSATVEIETARARVVFSGDLGRYGQDVMKDPARVEEADYLVLESTYGDKLHSRASVEDALAQAIEHVVEQRGALVIPSFAVGRAQHVMYYLRRLQNAGRMPRGMPVYVDSPMAIDATRIYCDHGDETNLNVNLLMDDNACPLRCHDTRFVRKPLESKRLNEAPGPFVVISANGMCTAGRIVHHLKHRLPDSRNAVLFVGYQAAGTRGRRIVDGARNVRIHGENVPVEARIFNVDALSGHADQAELLRWLDGFRRPPSETFLVHGEPHSARGLRDAIEAKLGWKTTIPRHAQTVHLRGTSA